MYTDLLTKIKNAQDAKLDSVKVQYSNMNLAVLDVLEKHKFIDSISVKGRMPKRVIEVGFKYQNRKGAIHKIKFLSTPSRRQYTGYKDIKPIRQGFGLLVLSTPKGILDGKAAKKQKLGGQLLFEIF